MVDCDLVRVERLDPRYVTYFDPSWETGLGLFAAIAQGLYDVGLDGRRVASAMPGVIPKSVRQHCEVAEAVLAGDVDRAVSAYRRHLEHVLETTIQSMAETRGRE